MRELKINGNEAGQRLDKFLAKYMSQAPKSFFYKMLRKKNITLNGKKAEGKEILAMSDVVRLFLAEDTIEKFRGAKEDMDSKIPMDFKVIYENEHVAFLDKPAGLLSQKADKNDISLVEQFAHYAAKSMSAQEQRAFSPAICNRLDRNTSGLVVAGKTLLGLQQMSQMIKERTLQKLYLTVVVGEIAEPGHHKAWLKKKEKTNQVELSFEKKPDYEYVETAFVPLSFNGKYTLLQVDLITGKTHQIRAHLAGLGHPVVGDSKYGEREVNQSLRGLGLRHQLLHSWRILFPTIEQEGLRDLSGKTFEAPVPRLFEQIMKK